MILSGEGKNGYNTDTSMYAQPCAERVIRLRAREKAVRDDIQLQKGWVHVELWESRLPSRSLGAVATLSITKWWE